MNCKLFIGNISGQVSQLDLERLFSPYGTVHTATIIRDLLDGRPRGFGFVILDSPEEASEARDALDGVFYKGLFLNIQLARPRTEGVRRPGTFWGRRPDGRRSMERDNREGKESDDGDAGWPMNAEPV
jgi:RNA recognition motif-containing protein